MSDIEKEEKRKYFFLSIEQEDNKEVKIQNDIQGFKYTELIGYLEYVKSKIMVILDKEFTTELDQELTTK